MIVLDNNVISEAWRARPDAAVATWFDAQPVDTLFICTPAIAELRFGLERLPNGARKRSLASFISQFVETSYRERILEFNVAATVHFGQLRAKRERIGRRIAPIDAMIAAIALANDMRLATRNVEDFADIGLTVVSPFDH